MLTKIILILALICMIVLPIFRQTGNYTTSSNIVKCADYDHPDDAITAIGASNKTLLVTESETCNTNFTVPANVTVKFEHGGKWTINNGITVNFNGQIEAGLWQVFEYSGTGTLAGTPIIKEVYPQKWATGDGTVENPWANDCIQKAYDFVPAGGTIFLRAGYYQLAGTVTVGKQINLIGEGINKTIIITANARGFQINADYCVIRNLTVDGDAQNDGSHQCINISQADYLLVENIEIKNAGYYGLNMNESNYGIYRNIHAHDNYRHGVHSGANIAGTNQNNIYRDIYCWNNGVDGFDDRGGPDSENNIFDNLQCWDNGRHGIFITTQSNGSLTNSISYNNTSDGIRIYAYSFLLSNCLIYSNTIYGLYIKNCDNVNLVNVISKNNGTSGGANNSGILIYNVPSTKLSSCQFYDDRDSPLQDYAIRTEGTTKYVEITNCKFMPNEKYAILNHANAIILSRDGEINSTIFGTSTPSFGTWYKGDIVRKTDGTSSTSPGWVCINSGTNGTLNGGATTGDTINGEAILIPSSLTGIGMDTYLDVAGAFAAKTIIQPINTLASTTVDQDSAAAQKVLNVAATTDFLAGEIVVIGRGTAREEIKIINTVQDGISLTMTENLAYEHTAVQADAVENALNMSGNATGTVDDAAVTYHNATWQAMACLGLDGDLVDDPLHN